MQSQFQVPNLDVHFNPDYTLRCNSAFVISVSLYNTSDKRIDISDFQDYIIQSSYVNQTQIQEFFILHGQTHGRTQVFSLGPGARGGGWKISGRQIRYKKCTDSFNKKQTKI